MSGPAATASLWRHRDFMRLWCAQSISAMGARITREGLPLAAILTISARPAELGALAALSMGPQALVGLFAGGYVDRAPRRAIMMGCDLSRAAIIATIPLAAWLHLMTMAHLYVAAALVGAASVLFDLADHAFLPSLIDRERLADGNSKLAVTDSLAEIGGPALAGVLVQALSAPIAIIVNAATYLASAAALARISKVEERRAPAQIATDWRADFRIAATAAFAHPLVRPILLRDVTASLFGSIFAALYAFYALRVLELTPAMLGVTVAAGGVGALAGALLATSIARMIGFGASIFAASLLSGVAALMIPLAHGAPTGAMLVLVAAQVGGDALAVAASISAASLRQSVIPSDLLGRVGAVFHVGTGAAAVIGALAGGALGEWIGPRPAMFVAAAGLIGAALWVGGSPLRRLRALTDFASPDAGAP
jgi:Na+/melibiose symporter-like transporter